MQYLQLRLQIYLKKRKTKKIHYTVCLFKGWRAIWVSYEESRLVNDTDIDTLLITAPKTTTNPSPLFFDILRFVKNLIRQSRDKIVPTIGKGIYTPNAVWQQTYCWSQVGAVWFVGGGSRIFLRRGCTTKEWRKWPVRLTNFKSEYVISGGGHPLYPPPRSAIVCGVQGLLYYRNSGNLQRNMN